MIWQLAAKSRKLIEKRTKDEVTRVENVDALLLVLAHEEHGHQDPWHVFHDNFATPQWNLLRLGSLDLYWSGESENGVKISFIFSISRGTWRFQKVSDSELRSKTPFCATSEIRRLLPSFWSKRVKRLYFDFMHIIQAVYPWVFSLQIQLMCKHTCTIRPCLTMGTCWTGWAQHDKMRAPSSGPRVEAY